jgi:hypothetical protein
MGEGTMDQPTRVVTTCAAAFLLASALYWLGTEHRPDGFLAILQDVLTPLYIVPFVIAGAISGNVHSPAGGFIFLVLFFEAFLIVLAVLWLMILVSRRRSSR